MKKITLYTDGACSGNPGMGGYGGILIYNNKQKEFSGFEEETTNNRMELTAVIKGLQMLKEKCEVDVYTDSAYVVNAFKDGWINVWLLNNWRTASKKPVLNVELWQSLINLTTYHKVNWFKVKGHSDNAFNNRCDALARGEINKNKSNSFKD